MIKEHDFIQKNKDQWERLNSLLKKHRRTFKETDEFGKLYQQATEDLSFSQTNFHDADVTYYLNNLIHKCHMTFYRPKKSKFFKFLSFFGKELPKIFFTLKYPILLSLIIFFISSTTSFLMVKSNVELTEIFVDSRTYEMVLSDLETRNKFGNFDNIPKEFRLPISILIWFNNSKVAVFAFVFGITLGLGTIFILITNGLMLGALTAIYYMNGHFADFISLILVHGSIELTAIFISGGAGFYIASAILNPNRKKRIDNIKSNSLIAFKCIIGVIALLLWAGLIEGLVTTLKLEISIRFTIAVINIIILIIYFIIGFLFTKKDKNLQHEF